MLYLCSPIIPGHEMIGKIVAVGEGVKQYKIGDRVGGSWEGGHDGKPVFAYKSRLFMVL